MSESVWNSLDDTESPAEALPWTAAGKSRSEVLQERVDQYFTELREPVFRYLLSCAAMPASSEDITQEVFLRLYRHLHAGERVGNLRAWVFRVAHNLLVDQRRREQKLTLLTPEVWNSLATYQPHSALDPEEQFLEREEFLRLQRGVDQLLDIERQCITLRASGLRYREVADTLGISLSTAVDHVNRAIKKLAVHAKR